MGVSTTGETSDLFNLFRIMLNWVQFSPQSDCRISVSFIYRDSRPDIFQTFGQNR